jgi:anti-sigma factor RsiW
MTREVLTCRDVIDLLADYLDEALAPEVLRRFERHLGECAACVAYLRTYRRTRELTGEVTRVAMPEEVKTRLRQFLLEQLRQG